MVSSYTVALFCHIFGVLLFVSGIVVAGLPFEVARRRTDPKEIAIILGLARTGVPLVGAGAAMVLGFGLWLVHLGHWGYDAKWVQWAISLFFAAVVLGAVGGQRPKRARLHAAELAAAGAAADDELRRALADPMSRAINYASAVAVLGILALMVFKPA